jgi:hypothetical protein
LERKRGFRIRLGNSSEDSIEAVVMLLKGIKGSREEKPTTGGVEAGDCDQIRRPGYEGGWWLN